jgi:hypothetical protein
MGKKNRQEILFVSVIFLIQIVFLIWVVWENHDWISTDGISYIGIAQYYASGQIDLAVSGYWSPMLSWLIAPLLGVVNEPLYAAQIAMGISAIVFLMGCMAIFRIMGIRSFAMFAALGIVVFFSVRWAIQGITPDLLMSGILCLAISRIMHPDWCDKPSVQFSAGLIFGAAYLAKAVALPLSFILIIVAGCLWTICQQTGPTRALRSVAITCIGLLLIAGPWILVLSFKYERPVFSTSAGISHAVLNPSKRGHPAFKNFHIPVQGRFSSWEDPNPKKYAHWTPFDSMENLRHQMRIIVSNAIKAVNLIKGLDFLGIGLVTVLLGFFFHAPWRENIRLHRWRWAAIFIGCLVGIYLPVAGKDVRYYLAIYPFLLGGSLGFMEHQLKNQFGQVKMLHLMVVILVSLSFLFPLATGSFFPHRPPYQAAKVLKEKLNALNISGPIASTSRLENIDSYTAFLMKVPWHGRSERAQTVEEVEASQAKIIIVDRGTLMDTNLKSDESFISLDERMFDVLGTDLDLGVKVYINTKR